MIPYLSAMEYNKILSKASNYIILETQTYIENSNEKIDIINFIHDLKLKPNDTNVICLESTEVAYKAFEDVKRVYFHQMVKVINRSV